MSRSDPAWQPPASVCECDMSCKVLRGVSRLEKRYVSPFTIIVSSELLNLMPHCKQQYLALICNVLCTKGAQQL